MLPFALRRLGGTVMVLFAVSVIVFLIFFATPGVNPARQMAGRQPTPATIAQIRHDFGLDRPLPVQYVRMMDHLLVKRDLISYTDRGKVLPRVLSAAPVTLLLVLGAAVIWVTLALTMALVAASRPGGIIDPLLTAVGMIGISLPVYWLGEVINLFTQQKLHDSLFAWLPGLGYTSPFHDPFRFLGQMLFPWITLAIGMAGLYARVLRADLRAVSAEDYVRTARAKGLSDRRVLRRHVLRTALIPFVSLFALDFGALAGGATILTEQVFGLPGVGNLTYQSLTRFDLPVVMAVVLYAALFVVVANVVVDVVYAWLDPRIRLA